MCNRDTNFLLLFEIYRIQHIYYRHNLQNAAKNLELKKCLGHDQYRGTPFRINRQQFPIPMLWRPKIETPQSCMECPILTKIYI